MTLQHSATSRQPGSDRDSDQSRHDSGPRWIHFACDPLPWPDTDCVQHLGGKGRSLSMLSAAGLPVPPAFTITTEACRYYHTHAGQWPDGLWPDVLRAVQRLEALTGRTLGQGPHPLTLAVRSGAAQSMPGLMVTVLHCGLTEGYVRERNDELIWEAFAEFLRSYPAIPDSKADHQPNSGASNAPARQFCERVLTAVEALPSGVLSNDPETLLRHSITAVIDSWDSPAARRFRELQGGNQSSGTAITVQAMFNAELAGVVFSRDPERSMRNELVVEVVPGLGRALVGGQTTPARWIVDRDSMVVIETCVPEILQANLPIQAFDQQTLEKLCRAVLAIEAIHRVPVDVEFGYADGELAFFQARPVVQRRGSESHHSVLIQERNRLQEWAKQGRDLWVRHNLAETLPAPTPLTWDLWQQFMSGQGGYGSLQRTLGFHPSSKVRHEGVLELIAGRIYADPKRMIEMIAPGYPLTFDPAVLRDDPSVLNRPPTHLDLEQIDTWFLLRWPLLLFRLIRAAWRGRILAARAITDFQTRLIPDLCDYLTKERQVNLSRLSVVQLVDLFERRRARVFEDFAPQTLLPGTLGAMAWFALEQRLCPILGRELCRSSMRDWLSEIQNSLPVDEFNRVQVGTYETKTRNEFLASHGHRGPNEMDLSAPRWREIPDLIVPDVSGLQRSLPLTELESATRRSNDAALDNHLRIILERNGARCLHRELAPLLQRACTLLPYREIGKHEFLKVYDLLREVVVETSRRMSLGDGIHFLTSAEFRLLASTPVTPQLEQLIAERRSHHRACQQLHVPAVLDINRDLADFGMPPDIRHTGQVVSGSSLSAGQAAGFVVLFQGIEQLTEITAESVIVSTTLDPAMLPFLTNVAALIVEHGGMLSHLALLAREFSIPTVVIPQVTSLVQPGMAIRVDADRGVIELGERHP